MASSSGTLSSGITLPSSSHTVVAFPLRASNLHPRFISLSSSPSLPSLQAHQATRITSVGFINTPKKTGNIEEAEEEEGYDDIDGEAAAEDWEEELLDELDPLLSLHNGKQKKSRRQKHISNTTAPSTNPSVDDVDWVEHARQRALRALEAQNPKAANYLRRKIEPNPDTQKQQRNKKKKLKKKLLMLENSAQPRVSAKRLEKVLKLQDDANSNSYLATAKDANAVKLKDIVRFVDTENNVDLDDINSIEDLPMDDTDEFGTWQVNTSLLPPPPSVSTEGGNSYEQMSERERDFNRRLVEAKNALEVLEVVGIAEERTRLLGFPSLLTPVNTATALHRAAKHMETLGASKNDRLAFARKRQMAGLVGRSMEVLPSCSAQGLSNISWALSKIGGSTLYHSEMDLIANAILSKVSEFNSQNVANTLGAYASMQHVIPSLFVSLCNHALDILESFNSQELAQVLWAHAELMQQVDPLLDALDSVCLLLEKGSVGRLAASGSSSISFPSDTFNPFGNASADHLANLAWSYAVLNQIHRPSFEYLWQVLESILGHNNTTKVDSIHALSTWHLSQIHQVNLCLQYEYPHIGSTLKGLLTDVAAEAWERYKVSTWSTSEYQKDVRWHLVSMGQNWVAEYTAADYSLDLALPEEKMAIEIDGPSHFIRNTGSPLGHTILKKRLMSCAGWRLFSISYKTWEELDGETEQMNFLKELLKTGA